MAISLDTLNDDRLHKAIHSFRHMFSSPPAPAAKEESAPTRSPEAQELFDVKAKLLEQVRATAAETGERPTLEEYRLATLEFEKTDEGKAMAERGEWKPAIAADLSGQDLSGFKISEPKKANGSLYAKSLAVGTSVKEETHGHHIAPNYDGNNNDGTGQIESPAFHAFYDNMCMDDANCHNTFIEPATSFNDQVAKAQHLEGITFSGMQEGDTFHFGPGQYKDIRMENINGGEIIFDNNSHVDHVHIEGKHAKITIHDHVVLDHIEVNDQFRILTLEMGQDSIVKNSDLSHATFSQGSHFEPGATFKDVQLGANVQGLDFSGLKLNNVSIEGEMITSTEQLTAHGIQFDNHTRITTSAQHAQAVNGPQAEPQSEIDRIRATLLASQESIGTPLTGKDKEAAEATMQAREARLQQQASMPLPPLPSRRG